MTAEPLRKDAPVPSRTHPARPFRRGGSTQARMPSRTTHFSKRPRGGMRRPSSSVRPQRSSESVVIPPLKEGDIRIIPLGGVEEVGKNMTAIEFGNDIIVVDAGFQFKDEETPGIDYILPNTKYLEERKDKIRALFITHGHLDHIGGIPYIIDKIGYPPIYTRQFGAIMIQKRQEEFLHLKPLDIKIIDGEETITCGVFKVKTFPISHTIPDSMGIIIETPYGDIVFIEDVRVDNVKGVPTEEEVAQYKRFAGKEALLLTMDSTSIEKPGFSLSENVVTENLERFIKSVGGRLIIATFASQVERINAIIKLKDNLYRSPAKIVTYLDSDIHASGHGNKDELRWIHQQVKYRFFIPVHGNHYMLRQHAEMSTTLGTPKENVIVPDNGSIIEITENGTKIGVLKEKAPNSLVLVDGFAIGDAQEVVIRDRQLLAEDGMFVIIASLNIKTGKLRKSPDIIYRGFVYLRESQDLLQQTRMIIKRTIEKSSVGLNPINFDFVKGNVTDAVEKFLFQKTNKRPIVIPVILGV